MIDPDARGHADLKTTQLYADLDASDLRSAIERIDGGGGGTSGGGQGGS